jgi:uncharacterized iron-regulated protein
MRNLKGRVLRELLHLNSTKVYWIVIVALALTSCAAPSASERSPKLPAGSGIQQARIIYIAEKHDEPTHHQLQSNVIRSLYQRGKPVTVGMEMIDFTQQAALDQYLQKKISWSEFSRRTGFERDWGKTSPAYKRILAWCRRNKVPVIGLNAPQSLTRKLARNQKLTSAEAALIPNFPEPSGGFKKFKAAMAGHPGSSALRRYYEAQRAWDTTMAQRILAWLPDHQGTMVVLLGRFHADPQTGVPWYVARSSNVDQVILYPAE